MSDLGARQEMRGRPVTYEEAIRAAQRLINRAHNCAGEKSTMSIPVQASDDDIIITDYLTEANSREQELAALRSQLAALTQERDNYHRLLNAVVQRRSEEVQQRARAEAAERKLEAVRKAYEAGDIEAAQQAVSE